MLMDMAPDKMLLKQQNERKDEKKNKTASLLSGRRSFPVRL